MAYTKTAWQDSPSTATPINATNLNHIEGGIYDAHTGIATLDTTKATKQEVSQLNNDLTIASTSESTTISDSADGYIRDFSAYGKSEQKNLSGKNKLVYPYSTISGSIDSTGISATVDSDGTVTMNGTATANGQFYFRLRSDTLQKFAVGNYIASVQTSLPSKVYLAVNHTSGSSGVLDGNTSESSLNFTVESEDTPYGMWIAFNVGAVFNNTKFYPMIRLASVTDATYEPYCGGIPSPNPSYPQEIKSWDGDVRTHGKNLLKLDFQQSTVSGMTYTLQNDGGVKIVGTRSGYNALELTPRTLFIRKGNYVFTMDNQTGSQISILAFGLYDASGNAIESYITNKTHTDAQYSFSVTQDGYLRLSTKGNADGSVYNGVIYFGVVKATETDKSYVPYHSTLASLGISLYGIKVASGGNYTDSDGNHWISDKLDLRKGVVERYVGKVNAKDYLSSIYSASTQGGTNKRYYFLYDMFTKKYGDDNTCEGYCSHFKGTSANKGYSGKIIGYAIQTDRINFYSDYQTLDDFKSFVNDNNIYIVDALATPTTETLTDAQISALKGLQTYSDGTFVEYGTLQPFASIDYFTDTDNGKAVAEVDAKYHQILDLLSAQTTSES